MHEYHNTRPVDIGYLMRPHSSSFQCDVMGASLHVANISNKNTIRDYYSRALSPLES